MVWIWIWTAVTVIALVAWHLGNREDEDPSKPSVERALRAARTYDERRRSKR